MIDSSVLVAAFHAGHPHFNASMRFLDQMPTEQAIATLHSINETYVGITRMPIQPRAMPEHAKIYIDSLKDRIQWVTLDKACYDLALDLVTQLRVPGAKIYDALIVAAAKQIGATTLYTWNVKDFELLAPATGIATRTPDAQLG
jgi:predicted nucleic acid-binding protein